MESKVILIMVKRTKKEFRDYNEYKDRPFGLKWGTAYAMDDLMKGVIANEHYALKDNQAYPQMSRVEIDLALSESFLQHKEVEVQLNLCDEFGRLQDCFSGIFHGEAYEDYFVFNDNTVFWEDVRHVRMTDAKKWSDINIFEEQRPKPAPARKKNEPLELQLVKDEFYQPFLEELENDDN